MKHKTKKKQNKTQERKNTKNHEEERLCITLFD